MYENKWIPVTERLPKCFGTFIVAVTEPDKTRYTDSADYDPFLKTWKTSNYFAKGYEVTHWMPLPEAPKDSCTEKAIAKPVREKIDFDYAAEDDYD